MAPAIAIAAPQFPSNLLPIFPISPKPSPLEVVFRAAQERENARPAMAPWPSAPCGVIPRFYNQCAHYVPQGAWRLSNYRGARCSFSDPGSYRPARAWAPRRPAPDAAGVLFGGHPGRFGWSGRGAARFGIGALVRLVGAGLAGGRSRFRSLPACEGFRRSFSRSKPRPFLRPALRPPFRLPFSPPLRFSRLSGRRPLSYNLPQATRCVASRAKTKKPRPKA